MNHGPGWCNGAHTPPPGLTKNIPFQPSARLGEANEKNLNFNPERDLQPQFDPNMKGGLIMKASIIVDVHACINL